MSHIAEYEVKLTAKTSPAVLALAARNLAQEFGQGTEMLHVKSQAGVAEIRSRWTGMRMAHRVEVGDVFLAGGPVGDGHYNGAILRVTPDGVRVLFDDMMGRYKMQAWADRVGTQSNTLQKLIAEHYMAAALRVIQAHRGFKVAVQRQAGQLTLVATKA